MEAETRELAGRDIVADVAGSHGLGQQVADHGAELLLRSGDVLVSMQARRQFGVVMPMGLGGDERVGLEYGCEPLTSVASREFLGVLFAALLGAVSITGEFRHGTIRSTFLAAPRRGRVVAAKVIVSMLIGAAFGLSGCALAAAVGSAALRARGIDIRLDGVDYALLLVGSAAAGALWAAIGVGLGAVVRNQVPTLIGICAWLLFVEGLLVGNNTSFVEVGRFGPGAAAAALTGQGPGTLLPPAVGLLVLALYAAAAALAGWLATSRRDVA